VEAIAHNAFGQRQVAQIYAPNNSYQVIMRVAPEFQRDASALNLLHLRTPSGEQVPLSSLTAVEQASGRSR
jgi:HAE1 family hydrophobic/amphiphilic exporter-1